MIFKNYNFIHMICVEMRNEKYINNFVGLKALLNNMISQFCSFPISTVVNNIKILMLFGIKRTLTN